MRSFVHHPSWLVSPRRLHEAQDVDEEVDEVEVEVDGRKDVLLRRHLVHDHVGVEDDEAAEESGPAHRDDKLGSLAPEEHLHTQHGTRVREIGEEREYIYVPANESFLRQTTTVEHAHLNDASNEEDPQQCKETENTEIGEGPKQ